ncbi:hypothetical protein QBC43DRAFT_212270 [Cladorrhinum sp. PSN259]|nr:hypothetical protein QBC43DRAFT_212270 [Cladorrhinum sp. PSN259]
MSSTTKPKPLCKPPLLGNTKLLPSLSSLLPSATIPLSSPIWTLLERLYSFPSDSESTPRPKRTKPMHVLCVGLPRSGTESLQQALMILGYDYTYHGWDIVYPSPSSSSGKEPHRDAQLWTNLARQKFHSPVPASTSQQSDDFSASTFDSILATSQAVTDAPASLFASEMISAYPEALVILNSRRDTAAWKKSLLSTIVKANESWAFWVASWADRECFWAWHVYFRFLWPRLFRVGPGETLREAVECRAEQVMRDHHSAIKGLVPPQKLLLYSIEEGWAPLCKFLKKPIPDTPFPHANAAAGAAKGGWGAREEQCNKRWIEGAFLRLFGIAIIILLAFFGLFWR